MYQAEPKYTKKGKKMCWKIFNKEKLPKRHVKEKNMEIVTGETKVYCFIMQNYVNNM